MKKRGLTGFLLFKNWSKRKDRNAMNHKTADLLSQAEEGIKTFLSSDKYKEFLRTMSKFHTYSLNNTLLILMQKPEATRVAGYKTWKNTFNRQVNKGEKALKIIGGRPYKRLVEELENGKKVKKEVQGISFFPVSVFDVSQTSGDPLPQLTTELQGEVTDYSTLYAALKRSSEFAISFEEISGGAKGYCAPLEKRIALQQGMSQAQTIKTLIHEMTHAELHAPEVQQNTTERTSRSTKEVEAESTAFVVCEHYGIDTRDYSFPYLASWSSDKELSELKNSFEKILKKADELIQKIDSNLELLQKEQVKEPEKTPSLAEKLDALEEKANALNEQRAKENLAQKIQQQRNQTDSLEL